VSNTRNGATRRGATGIPLVDDFMGGVSRFLGLSGTGRQNISDVLTPYLPINIVEGDAASPSASDLPFAGVVNGARTFYVEDSQGRPNFGSIAPNGDSVYLNQSEGIAYRQADKGALVEQFKVDPDTGDILQRATLERTGSKSSADSLTDTYRLTQSGESNGSFEITVMRDQSGGKLAGGVSVTFRDLNTQEEVTGSITPQSYKEALGNNPVLPPAVFMGLIQQESNFNPFAIGLGQKLNENAPANSNVGRPTAAGLGQFVKGTAATNGFPDIDAQFRLTGLTSVGAFEGSIFNPENGLEASANYLDTLNNQINTQLGKSDVSFASEQDRINALLQAYNQGSQSVLDSIQKPPASRNRFTPMFPPPLRFSTYNYSDTVLNRAKQFGYQP